jgi:hypothetical protein
VTSDSPAAEPARTIGRTPRERAWRIWRVAFAAVGLAVVVTVLSGALPALGTAGAIAGPALLIAAILTGTVALGLTTRRPEALWIVCGLFVYWVANSALYLHLAMLANTTLATVPDESVIALLSTLFAAGVAALIAAMLVATIGWVLRPGRWNALNGPGGQS